MQYAPTRNSGCGGIPLTDQEGVCNTPLQETRMRQDSIYHLEGDQTKPLQMHLEGDQTKPLQMHLEGDQTKPLQMHLEGLETKPLQIHLDRARFYNLSQPNSVSGELVRSASSIPAELSPIRLSRGKSGIHRGCCPLPLSANYAKIATGPNIAAISIRPRGRDSPRTQTWA